MNEVVRSSVMKRVALEAGIIQSQMSSYINCSKLNTGYIVVVVLNVLESWRRENFKLFDIQNFLLSFFHQLDPL